MMKRKNPVILAAIGLTLAVGSALGDSIGINVGANGAIPAEGVAGVVPAANWNDLTGPSNNPTSSSLVDSGGFPVPGMTASFTGTQDTFNNNGVPDRNMLSGFLRTTDVELTGIPYSTYDVYVYYNGFLQNYSLTWTATDNNTETLLSTLYSVRGTDSSIGVFLSSGPGHVLSSYDTLASADEAAAAGTGGTYLVFSGLSTDRLTIAEISNNGFNENGFTGIQVVQTSIPAPFAITGISRTSDGSSVTITFNSQSNRSYAVDVSTSLLPGGEPGGWEELDDSIPGSAGTQTDYTDTDAASRPDGAFYRVRDITT